MTGEAAEKGLSHPAVLISADSGLFLGSQDHLVAGFAGQLKTN